MGGMGSGLGISLGIGSMRKMQNAASIKRALIGSALAWLPIVVALSSFTYGYDFVTLNDPAASLTVREPGGATGTAALGIDGSTIVGTFTNASGGHGFVYNGSAYTTLDDPSASGTSPFYGETSANGISGSTAVGSYHSGSLTYGFIHNGTNFVTLQYPSASLTAASGIDGSNIVGGAYTSSGAYGYIYNGGTFTTLTDPLAVGVTLATGISGSTIVGNYLDASANAIGFIYNNGVYTSLSDPLATNGTVANGVSGSIVVGDYHDAEGTHGFFYSNGVYTTLDDPNTEMQPGDYYTVASGVSGDTIVGYYDDASNDRYGFEVVVPEPGSLGLLCLGGVLLLAMRRGPRGRVVDVAAD